MFYKKSTRYARLKAAVALPLAVCIVMIFAISCKQSDNKTETGTTDSTVTAKAIMTTDSAGEQKLVVTGSDVPPPPPLPPPPPPSPTKKNGNIDENGIYTVVETMPEFPGGEEARIKYMSKNIKYPKDAYEKGAQGTVYVSFVVEKDGSIGEAKVLRGVGKSCDQEALRVVKGMPKWTPGKQSGKPVRVQFNMPVQFKLTS